MTATVIAFPSADFVTTERRSINGRIGEIHSLAANPGPLTQFAIMTVLEQVCDNSLRGAALWSAWLAARDALEIFWWTDPDAEDYDACKHTAGDAVLALVHGSNYHGGSAA